MAAVQPTPAAHHDPAHTKLHNACVEMEAFLWGFVFRNSALAGTGKGVFQDSSGTQSFREMLDTERARQMSARGGPTLSSMLYRELERKMAAEAPKGGSKP